MALYCAKLVVRLSNVTLWSQKGQNASLAAYLYIFCFFVVWPAIFASEDMKFTYDFVYYKLSRVKVHVNSTDE